VDTIVKVDFDNFGISSILIFEFLEIFCPFLNQVKFRVSSPEASQFSLVILPASPKAVATQFTILAGTNEK
jgi:hypothetical protein